MYKIVDRTGYEMENGFNNLRDAIARIRELRQSGMKHIVVIDECTSIVKKRASKRR
jgi:hypothetical protein